MRGVTLEERRAPRGVGEQLLELALARRIPSTQLDDASRALLGWRVEQLIEQRRQLRPVRRQEVGRPGFAGRTGIP
jgi:hypothetical protein